MIDPFIDNFLVSDVKLSHKNNIFYHLGGEDNVKSKIKAKNITITSKTVSFSFIGCSVANFTEIELNNKELYNMYLKQYKGYGLWQLIQLHQDIYSGHLRDYFEKSTGLKL